MGNKQKQNKCVKRVSMKRRLAGKANVLQRRDMDLQVPINVLPRPTLLTSTTISQTNTTENTQVGEQSVLDTNVLITSSQMSAANTSQHTDFAIIEKIKSQSREIELSGRRIIHMQHFLSQLVKFSTHSKAFGCTLENLTCESETRIGLISKFTFRCNFCKYRQIIESDSNEDNVFDTNKSAVSGILTIGGGFSALNQFLHAIDVPSLSEKFYQKIHSEITEKLQETAADAMAAAAAEERDLALEEGRVDKNGTPVIDVVADGCWAKRSYRTNYSSASGTAAIIGKRSGKVLFLAVRNKYCSICEYSKTKDIKIPHKCYKNYTGTSTGMESDILVEGFKKSIQMYNLIYGRLISDGDSSTYCKILEARPYPHTTVEKIECINHLLRNFCSKLRSLTSDTRFPLKLRKLLTQQRIMSLRRNVKKVIKHYQNTPASHSSKVDSLHSDINNLLLHIFNIHTNCKTHYCSEDKGSNPQDVTELRVSGLWLRMSVIVSSLAAHSRSLLHSSHSNIVESFNSIIAKHIGGKRINFTNRGSYTARAFAAVVSFNTKEPLYTLQKSFINRSPSSKIKKYERGKLKRYEASNKNRKVKRKINLVPQAKKQADYGSSSMQPDMDTIFFEKNKKMIMDNLRENALLRDQIERETTLQREDTKWLELRSKMLTASSFGSVVLRRDSTSCRALVKNLLSGKNLAGVASIRHGTQNEKVAIKQLEQEMKVSVQPCGLFIDQFHPFLGATPDGLIGSDTIVEVKCPITSYKLGLEEAITKKKVKFWTIRNGSYIINQNHPWFIQVQGQLHVTQRKQCLFAVWSGENRPIKTETILRDDNFWKQKMEYKLVRFYKECLLPEIIDSRISRGMPVREPEFIEKAMLLKLSEKKKQETDQINAELDNIQPACSNYIQPTCSKDIQPTCSKDAEVEGTRVDVDNTSDAACRIIQFSEF